MERFAKRYVQHALQTAVEAFGRKQPKNLDPDRQKKVLAQAFYELVHVKGILKMEYQRAEARNHPPRTAKEIFHEGMETK